MYFFVRSRWRSVILLILLLNSFGSSIGCRGPTAPDSPTPLQLTSTTIRYTSTFAHLSVLPNPPWQMSQSNSLNVSISGINESLILAAELAPQFAEAPISQKPVILDGTPVAGRFEEITGYLAIHRVDPGVSDISVVFPAAFFDPTLYNDVGPELLGWELRIVLTSQISAYPVHSGMSLGKEYPITPQHIQAQQTWIQSEAESQTPIGSLADARLVVPNSSSGIFLYYPVSMIKDSLTLSSSLDFNFK